MEDNVLNPFSSLIPYYGASFLLFNGQRDVEISDNDNVSQAVLAKKQIKGISVAAFFRKNVRNIHIKETYLLTGDPVKNICEDPVVAAFFFDQFKFGRIPESGYSSRGPF